MDTEFNKFNNKIIAVVDDEEDIIQLVSVNLSKNGFIPKTFKTGKDFLNFIEKENVDLIILDIMLTDNNGLDICKFLRSKEKYSSIPIIFLSARIDEIDKIIGFEIGCDDYITKPFSPRELIARIKAILKRTVDTKDNILKISDNITIDHSKYDVIVNNEKIELTITEFKILSLLASDIGKVFSREQILDHLWKNEKYVIDRTVDVHIRHLRKKIKDLSENIKNIRGVGYKLTI